MFILKNRIMEEAGEGESGGEAAPTVEALLAQVTSLNAEKESMSGKMNELLGEAKKAKSLQKTADAAAATATEEKAKAAGDFEQLHKSAMQKNTELTEQIKTRDERDSKKEIKNEAFKIASMLADNVAGGSQNATLLSNEIAQRLKHADGELKVTDLNGNLTISSLEDLQTEFKNNPAYSGLLKGNQSSGGGATGGSNSGGAAKVKTRADFEALNHVDRIKYVKGGGKITD